VGNKEVMPEGGQVDMQAEDVQEDVRVDLSVGVCCKNYDEPARRTTMAPTMARATAPQTTMATTYRVTMTMATSNG
jgi:hypothetical protein